MAKSLCQLLIKVNYALVANLNVASMSFNAIRENKILAKIVQYFVVKLVFLSHLLLKCVSSCSCQYCFWHIEARTVTP